MARTRGIRAGWLVLSPADIRPDHALVLEEDRVVDVVPNLMVAADRGFLDARDAIVAPGFINAHMHMYGMLSHGMEFTTGARSLKLILEEFWWPRIEDRLDHDLIRLATEAACVDLLRGGVTTFSDILEAPNALPGCLAVEAEVVERAGLRAVLSFEATERVTPDNGRAGLRENADFIRRQKRRGSRLVQGMMCVHTTFTCSLDFLREARGMARELGGSIQLHLSESGDESRASLARYGKLPVEVYEEIGFLDAGVLASQCVVMDPAEIALLVRRGVRVAHQPVSNCSIGGGIAPVPDMLAAGIPIGLGTDGEVNDMFEVMRIAHLIHKGHRRDPAVMPPAAVLAMATEMGARALGLADAGVLRPGAHADLVVINADTPTPLNHRNLLEQIVLYRKASDLRAVMIAGQWVWRDGKALNLDEQRITRDLREVAPLFWEERE
ncbi:MAG: amidohydrolase [Bacillota bacterium]|nr:MAG: amidohydrolase [Bacillota bacterium]